MKYVFHDNNTSICRLKSYKNNNNNVDTSPMIMYNYIQTQPQTNYQNIARIFIIKKFT